MRKRNNTLLERQIRKRKSLVLLGLFSCLNKKRTQGRSSHSQISDKAIFLPHFFSLLPLSPSLFPSHSPHSFSIANFLYVTPSSGLRCRCYFRTSQFTAQPRVYCVWRPLDSLVNYILFN